MAEVYGIDTQSGVRSDGTRWHLMDADGVVIDGIVHRPGDEVMVADLRGGAPFLGRIVAIQSKNRGPWRCQLDSDFGPTSRSIGQLSAVSTRTRAA